MLPGPAAAYLAHVPAALAACSPAGTAVVLLLLGPAALPAGCCLVLR